MLQFNFNLSDIDAENLFDCIDDCINETVEMIYVRQPSISLVYDNKSIDKLKAEIVWFEKRIGYLKDLKKKLKWVRICS